MADKTGIEWTDATWNPTTGCDQVSPGCDNCYALTMAKRLKAMGSPRYQNDGDPKTSGPGFGLTTHVDVLDQPLRWTKPRRIFVNSMSDLFHQDVTDDFLARVFAVMSQAPQHTFQVLTKRHGRMRSLLDSPTFVALVDDHRGAAAGDFTWPLPNVWLGVSVENQQWADIRIRALLGTPAAVRFLSCEPLLGPIDLAKSIEPNFAVSGWKDLSLLDWVIVGGESGPGARAMHPDWARSLRDQSVAASIAFHFKQWGEWAPAGYQNGTHLLQVTGQMVTRESGTTKNPYGHGSGTQDLVDRGHQGWVRVRHAGKRLAGRELDGRTWDEYPGEAVMADA